MTEHVHEYCFGVTLNEMVERLRDPAIVECDHCDHVLNEGEILSRLNAAERLSVEDARKLSAYFVSFGYMFEEENKNLRAYADILEAK